MKKKKKPDVIIESIPGWEVAEFSSNLFTPCNVCKRKEKTMFWKLVNGKSLIACQEHAEESRKQ